MGGCGLRKNRGPGRFFVVKGKSEVFPESVAAAIWFTLMIPHRTTLSRLYRKDCFVSLATSQRGRGGPDGASPQRPGAARAERWEKLQKNRERVENPENPRGV